MSPVDSDAKTRARDDIVRGAQRGVLAGLALLALALAPGVSPEHPPTSPTIGEAARALRFADFGVHPASAEARHVADWIADSGDNAGADFILLDKRQAMLYVFDAEARLRDASPVLLGAARGDASTPGIGTRAIAEVQPHERTTPAGRFVAERGRNTLGEDVVWVDYDAAVSIHRVRATQPSERRLQRLASETIDDNRISYGCINVPVAFYETFVGPTVAQHRTIVYVLPETSPAQQLFGSYDVAARHTFRSDPKKQLSRLQ
jgi:hypothetical protein